MSEPHRLSGQLSRDLRRGARIGLRAALPLIAVEFILTAWTGPGDLALSAIVQLAGLSALLMSIAALLAAGALGLTAVGARLAVWTISPTFGRAWSGLLGPDEADTERLPAHPIAPLVWMVPIATAAFIAASTALTVTLNARFHAPVLVAGLLGVIQVALFGLAAGATLHGARLLTALGARLGERRLNPLTSVRQALTCVGAIGLLIAAIAEWATPAAPLIPGRHIVVLALFVVFATMAMSRPSRLSRRAALVGGVIGVLAIGFGLTRSWSPAKEVALVASPPMVSVMSLVRFATDVDRDGFGSLLGENDCAPFDPAIRPGVADIPNNGIDENCNGQDFVPGANQRARESLPVPDPFERQWNVLLLTVDTLRYDRTGFGGHTRDTTPHLDRLAERSSVFTFANAPSAGTMASIPAILVSRFFHSGIALEKKKRRLSLAPSNVLLPELLKNTGYATGAVLTHRYFEMGQNQGFDHYDNRPEEYRHGEGITSPQITDRALEWIGKQREPWFMWAHYIDPHSAYVPHPGGQRFGESALDRYDGEVHATDKQIGRLISGIDTMGQGSKTVVIVTSDHGDAFNEHGVSGHAATLYREILHVPLIIHVPGHDARRIDGAVSPMDIYPTVAGLIGARLPDSAVEGQSLVPQLFYDRDAHDRVVFAETNFRRTLRTAVTSRHKLIHDLGANTFELYDLEADPLEAKNIWNDPAAKEAAAVMRGHIDQWLERVFYSRDTQSNLAATERADILLAQAPSPRTPITLATTDGTVRFIGWDPPPEGSKETRPPTAGLPFEIMTYFASDARTDKAIQGRIVLTNARGRTATGRWTPLGGKLFDSRRWRPGEFVKQSIEVIPPAKWPAGRVKLRLELSDRDRKPIKLGKAADRATIGSLYVGPLSAHARAAVPIEQVEARAGGIAAQYFAGMAFERLVHERIDQRVRLSTAGSPAPGVPEDEFSARWTGFIKLAYDGLHTVCADGDDGTRIYIGGQLVVEDWSHHARRRRCGTIIAMRGWHPLKVDHYEYRSKATLELLIGRTERSARGVRPQALCCTAPAPTATPKAPTDDPSRASPSSGPRSSEASKR